MQLDPSDDGRDVQPAAFGDSDARQGRGRPRDPELERRTLSAVLEVLGEGGWAGLTIDEVAARARVGKSSIYLRWRDKSALLADALRQVQLTPSDASLPVDCLPAASKASGQTSEPGSDERGGDTGARAPLRSYLVDHALHRARLYLGPHGLAMLRLYVEAMAQPDVLAEIRQRCLTEFVLAERHRVQRAVQDGELPPDTSVVHLLDAIEGAVFVHVLVTPPHLMERVRQTIRPYVEQLVDNQLRAAGAGPAPAPR